MGSSDLFDYTDEQWSSFYEKASFLSPNVMRVMLHDGDSYCIGFEDDGTPIYDWESVMMKRVYKILDFAQQNDIPIMLGEWRSISERGYLSYDDHGKTVNWSSPTWAMMIGDCLEHLIVDKGYTCIKYYNMINEPKRDHGDVTNEYVYDQWKQAITNLRNEMDSSGIEKIENIKIVGPDVYDSQEAWINQATSDEMKDKIELTEVHRYAPQSEVESGLIEKKLKTWKEQAESLDPEVAEEGFALGEMGISGTGPGDSQLNARKYDYGVDIFDYGVQAIRAGLKFGSVWGFEDSMHVQHNDIVNNFKDQYGPAATTEEGRDYVVHTPTGDPSIDNDIKIWGFWNELGEEMAAQNAEHNVTGRANTVKASDENLKPWYYTWSMLCRYFPSGTKILETTDSYVDQLRVTSGIIPVADDKGDISIAVVNNSSSQKTLEVNMPNAASKVDLNQYFYYDGEIDGKTRPVNEKGQLLQYDTIENANLKDGVNVTLPAKSCMILTSLGYEGESHPMSFTTGQTTDVEKVEIYETTNANQLEVGKSYQLAANYIPSISKGEMEWSVVDYFGNASDKALIDENGLLTEKKAGQFKVIGNLKGKPEIQDTLVFKATSSSILVDELNDLENGVALSYQDIIKDDNSANFNGDKTVKRSDSNANGKPGIITYQANNIYDFEFSAYSLNNNLDKSGNFVVEISQNGDSWSPVECEFIQGSKLSSGWYPYTIKNKAVIKDDGYQYLRVTITSKSGYKTYDPQYAGGSIYYDYQGASQIDIQSHNEFIVKGQELQFKAEVLPSIASQEVSWKVLSLEGKPTELATISPDGILTAKAKGEVVVVATAKDTDVSASTETNQWNKNPTGKLVNDGDYDTRWVSKDGTSITKEQITIDLGEVTTVDNVKLYWESARATDFNIEVSTDGSKYDIVEKLRDEDKNKLTNEISFDPVEARYVRMQGLTPATKYGYSIYEFEIYNNSDLKLASSVEFKEMSSELYLGENTALDVVVTPDDATYQDASYTSSNEFVVVCKNNQMIAVGEGTATITANVNGQKITKEITVVKDNARKIAQELTSLTVENGRVDFPTVDGYSFSVFSSDLEKVIAKDGSVNLPIEDQEVALVVTVSKDGSEDSANTDEIKVMVKGSRDKYELLEKRIKEIEETDWTVYKPGTVKTFKEKLQAVKESLNAEVLLVSEVEKAGENLEAAFKGLEIKSDKKTLDALIKELEELDTKVYTEVSVVRVEKALEKAETVSENEDASEAEVNDAVQALYEAKLGLVEQINYDNLKDRIEEIEKEDLSIYSEATAARLKEQIAEAKEALKNENITNEELQEELAGLNEKYSSLKLNHEPGSVEELIKRIEEMDLSGYSEASVKELERVIKEIKEELLEGVDQVRYAKLAEKLQTAYEGLERKSEVKPVEPEQLETPKGDEQAAKTGDNMIIGTWLITMSAAVMVVIFLNKRRSLEK